MGTDLSQKNSAFVENSSRGVWALVDNEQNPDAFSRKEIVDTVRAKSYQLKAGRCKQDECPETIESGDPADPDRKETAENSLGNETCGIRKTLLTAVARKRIHPVSSSHVRDFRGAMQGRSDKGLFLTTGKFTRDAIREASRDGVPPIDLLDGDRLCDKLKELRLGVMTETIEQITVLPEWFGENIETFGKMPYSPCSVIRRSFAVERPLPMAI